MGLRDLFGRRRGDTPRYEVHASLPLPSAEPERRWRERLTAAGLRYVKLTRDDRGCYFLTLAGDDAEAAKRYLQAEPVEKELYYIVVETPDGNWGTDIQGLYLERLRPWQYDTRAAECTGQVAYLPDSGYTLGAAGAGLAGCWVAGIACGRCGREWLDGLRYRDLTLVRCPSCGAANEVDSRPYVASHHD
jgi:hypothetical protein